jgi:hypothetical protein
MVGIAGGFIAYAKSLAQGMGLPNSTARAMLTAPFPYMESDDSASEA